jgi:murein DD-endopeptidase MepM/ murein hydrolase activator NlpD
MKKFYYISKTKIQSIDLKNYRMKFFGLVATIFAASCLFLLAIFYVYSRFVNPSQDLEATRNENYYLKNKLKDVSGLYKDLSKEIDSLKNQNKTLRTAVNLSPYSEDQNALGTGGGTFGNILEILSKKDGDLKSTISGIEAVINKFEMEKANLAEIKSAFAKNQELYKCLPAIQPCAGEFSENGFGMRYHPILHIMRMHNGVDIVTDIGTTVMAPADGKVSFVGSKEGFGLAVEIEHGFGYKTVYGHLSQALVKEGQQVTRFQKIALTGNSGLSTGPHLHYEVLHDGINLDPAQFIFKDSNLFTNTAN